MSKQKIAPVSVEEKESQSKVRDMAKLSILAGRISDVQEKNLKMYPLIFFEGVKTAVIDYDFSSESLVTTEENKKDMTLKYNMKGVETRHFKASYYLDLYEGAQNNNLEKRFAALENAVRTLFWKDTKVEVYFNNKKVYPSE